VSPLQCVLGITIKKHDFSKGPTWLKCTNKSRWMVVLIENMKHEGHELLLIETFDWNNIFNHATNQTFGQKH